MHDFSNKAAATQNRSGLYPLPRGAHAAGMFLVPLSLIALGAFDRSAGDLPILLAIAAPVVICILAFRPRPSWNWLWVTLAALAVFSTCLVSFAQHSGWHPYGWHNLMQMDAIYSTISGVDISYFSTALSYPFFGLLPLSLLSQMLDVSPLSLFVLLNAVCFTAWFAIYFVYTREEAGTIDSLLAVGIAFLLSGLGFLLYSGTSEIINAVASTAGSTLTMPVGEIRVSPIFSKYVHVDAMTIGLPSLAFQYYFSRTTAPTSRLLALLFGVQTIVSYPLLAPTALLIPLVCALFESRWRAPQLGIFALLLATFLVTLHFTSPGSGSGVSLRTPQRVIFGVVLGMIICSPFVVAVLYRSYRLKSPALARVPIIIFILSWGAFSLIEMPAAVQYKFLYGAMTVLGFEACREIAFQLSELQRKRATIAVGLLAFGFAACLYQFNTQAPPQAGARPGLDSTGFLISSRESRTIEAFRRSADGARGRGLIVSNADFPSSALLRVPQYMNLHDTPLVGYEMAYSFINVDIKRHGKADFEQRAKIASMLLVEGRYDLSSQLMQQLNRDYLLLISETALGGCPGQLRIIDRDADPRKTGMGKLHICLISNAAPRHAAIRPASIPAK